MRDVLESLKSLLPSHVLLGLLFSLGVFFGVYYFRGYRDYSQAARDKTFLTLVVLIGAGTLVYEILRHEPPPPPDRAPMVILPIFKNDEGDQVRSALGSQIEAALGRSPGRGTPVHYINVFLADPESAVDTARRLGALAVVHGPTVVTDGGTKKCSFRLTLVNTDITKTYPLIPLEAPKTSLDDIANTLLTAEAADPGQGAVANPLLARLDSLEKTVTSLRAELLAYRRSLPDQRTPPEYAARRAIVFATNRSYLTPSALESAESDARRMAAQLKSLGFGTTEIIGDGATGEAVIAALRAEQETAGKDDLFVFYYAGTGFTRGTPPVLQLVTRDTGKEGAPPLSAEVLRSEVGKIAARHRVCILDSCNGTTGLPGVLPPAGGEATQPAFDFLAGCQDDQFAVETKEGGVFTTVLLRALADAGTSGGLWMSELFTRVDSEMGRISQSGQRPKLVRLDGAGEVYWGK